ncbi:hypothetical protein KM295_14160 [Natronomonas sp. F2-12]|uniref:Uncharacterized protein n=1 Tax=Natronomonas aquatica TaxID=2841590 RepID=A0A9R1CVZ2_9EURY|nr:hypothetical protein [Natronomonas aquatica]MCQ4334599.1 hypothetical protein [Natronomonas aquatica]
MQTKGVLGLVLAFGLAFALLSGSGIGAAVFGESPGDAETTRTIDEVANQSSVDESDEGGLQSDVTGDNEPTLVGLAISGGKFLVGLVGAVALLPLTLMNLGFPAYFALPVGGIAQIIAFVGLVQFTRIGELK